MCSGEMSPTSTISSTSAIVILPVIGQIIKYKHWIGQLPTSFAHWLIEVVGSLSEDEIPCLVSLPRLHQAVVPGDGLLHDVVPPAEHSLLSDINIYSNYSSTISVIPRFGVNGNCSIFVVLDWRSSLVNQSPIRCWCEECWHSRAPGSDPLRQCSLTQDIMSH